VGGALLRWRTQQNQALYDLSDEDRGTAWEGKSLRRVGEKLAGILYAIWRDETEFDPQALRQRA
jgi:hypothetical protein